MMWSGIKIVRMLRNVYGLIWLIVSGNNERILIVTLFGFMKIELD